MENRNYYHRDPNGTTVAAPAGATEDLILLRVKSIVLPAQREYRYIHQSRIRQTGDCHRESENSQIGSRGSNMGSRHVGQRMGWNGGVSGCVIPAMSFPEGSGSTIQSLYVPLAISMQGKSQFRGPRLRRIICHPSKCLRRQLIETIS